ncbi:hypothetical protein ANO14919_077880 [Xylariales sp. No.14919]|nr:hypothetical protein ANO14919_077880 [Xylariales sp. No.14919]
MRFSISFFLSVLLLLGIADAGWREECGEAGNAQFNILWEKPMLSTLCPSVSEKRKICTMLDLSYCLMNSHGHLTPTINGNFHRSCEKCHLTGRNNTILSCSCRMFGKDAPFQDTEVDLEDFVTNRDGYLGCWKSQPLKCIGFQ